MVFAFGYGIVFSFGYGIYIVWLFHLGVVFSYSGMVSLFGYGVFIWVWSYGVFIQVIDAFLGRGTFSLLPARTIYYLGQRLVP